MSIYLLKILSILRCIKFDFFFLQLCTFVYVCKCVDHTSFSIFPRTWFPSLFPTGKYLCRSRLSTIKTCIIWYIKRGLFYNVAINVRVGVNSSVTIEPTINNWFCYWLRTLVLSLKPAKKIYKELNITVAISFFLFLFLYDRLNSCEISVVYYYSHFACCIYSVIRQYFPICERTVHYIYRAETSTVFFTLSFDLEVEENQYWIKTNISIKIKLIQPLFYYRVYFLGVGDLSSDRSQNKAVARRRESGILSNVYGFNMK